MRQCEICKQFYLPPDSHHCLQVYKEGKDGLLYETDMIFDYMTGKIKPEFRDKFADIESYDKGYVLPIFKNIIK